MAESSNSRTVEESSGTVVESSNRRIVESSIGTIAESSSRRIVVWYGGRMS